MADKDWNRRYGGGEYLSRYEFEEAMKRVDGRLDSQDSELGKVREKLHAIANTVAGIQVIKLQIDNIEKYVMEKKDGLKIWKVAVAGFCFAVILLTLQIIAKKLGLL